VPQIAIDVEWTGGLMGLFNWLLGLVGLTIDQAILYVVVVIVEAVLVVGFILAYAPLFSWVMRKVMARMQNRQGPMRVGPQGLLQPLADGVKLAMKEDVIPTRADKFGFRLAPYLVFIPVCIAFAPLPWSGGIILSDIRYGLLFIIAVSAIAPLGEIIAGWSSNNKFSTYGALRAAALDVSYEIPMVFSAAAIILLAGSASTQSIVAAQDGSVWFIVLQPLGALIFFIGALAKVGIVPMDLPEAESEIVAGYFTEYSGMRFGVFFLTVFVNIFLISAVTVTLFFGGWSGPFLPPLVWFLLKSILFTLAVLWIWFTLPRVRIDQFLKVGWTAMFPLSIITVVIAALEVYFMRGGLA
jgi:NADH-quinone oxidoreductase subunit H